MNKYYTLILLSLLIFLFNIIPPKVVLAQDDPFQSNWENHNSLPLSVASNETFTFNSRIYSLGGGAFGLLNINILSAHIDSSGALSTWSNIGSLPAALMWHNVIINNDNVYLIGGATESDPAGNPTSVDTTYRSRIKTDGTFDSWISQPNLPEKLASGKAILYNNRIYYIGGVVRTPGSSPQLSSAVYFANLNSDGSIQNWVQTLSLPQERNEFSVYVVGNSIIVIGGETTSSSSDNSILKGSIVSDGNIDNWELIGSMPENTRRPLTIQHNNMLLSMGGYNGSNFTNKIYYADISNNALPTQWVASQTTLPNNNCCTSPLIFNDRIYILGGHNGSTYYSTVNSTLLNISKILNIPNLKQHSNPWGDDVYDTASSWNPVPADTSIARWGCALTSGTMILQYFGYNFNPDVINEWFNASGKGYTPNGAVLWPAFSKLTKERQDLGNPKLEFKYKGATTAAIDAELNNGRPAILKYGKTNSQGKTVNHFVVATGKQGNEYLVNDPGSDTNTTKSQVESFWGMNLVNVGSFTPSQTDVSYIVASVPYGFDIQLFDSLGNLINGDYEIESPIVDVTDKDSASGNGISYNTLYIPKPDAGQYKLKVLGSGNYEMYLYLYDTEGGLEDFKFDGNISTEEIFDLYYDKTVSSSSTVEVVPQVEEVNFDNLISFIDQEYVNGGIKKKSTHTALKTLILVAKKHYENGREFVSRLTLKLSKEAIQKATPKYIKVDTSSELIQKINLLLDSL